jgi:hypothetical protein
MASASAATYRQNMVDERDQLRQAVVSEFAANDAGRGGGNAAVLLRQAGLLTIAIAELDAAAP